MPKVFSSTLLILLLLFSLSGWSQRRPKIGLVLSGGGAKGMAHVGVLKVMERAGLRPDYITGTSMGSVVGGLYAMGYSADDLEKIVENINWDDVLTNKIPLNEITIEEKPWYNRYAIELPVPKFFKVAFPGGIIEGEKLQQLFQGLTRPVHDINDFNKLPIPFACVATDIATGQPVILNKGSLAQSIRASMAIPTVFTPVEIDGKLLVDGGLVRNFPVQEVVDMGADIVIGVFVSDDLKSKDELNGIVDILFQTSWVLSAYDTRKQKEKVDYYLEPDHTGFGTADFKSSKSIIKLGQEEGEKFYVKFKKLADSIYAIQPKKPLKIPKATDEFSINSIVVEGNKKIPASLIRGKFGIEEHAYVSSAKVEKQVSLLFGTRHFTNVGYTLHKHDSTSYDLILHVKEAPMGKIKAAIHYDSENKAGINLNFTARNVLLPNSRILTEVDLAENPRANINYLKYVGKGQNIAAMLNADYNNFTTHIQNGKGSSSLFGIDQYGYSVTLFSTSFSNHTFGASFSRNHFNLVPKIQAGLNLVDDFQNDGYNAKVFYVLNDLERPFYPRRGGKATVSITGFFDLLLTTRFKGDTIPPTQESTKNIVRFDLDYLKIFPLSKRLSLVTDWRTCMSSQKSESGNSIIGTTYFGGFRPRVADSYSFYGAYNYDYSAASYVMAKADLQIQVKDNIYLTAGLNYLDLTNPLQWFDKNYPPTGDLSDTKTWRLGYGLSAGYMSVIGPISVGISMDSQRKEVIPNFSLGFYY